MPTIKLPQTSPLMKSGTIRKWLKNQGDTVAAGEILAEIETEEGLVQIESPQAGKLAQVLLNKGQTASAHAPLAVIDEIPAPSAAPAAAPAPAPVPAAAGVAPSSAGKVIPILMPKAGQSMEEGTILKWHVQPGAVIARGQVIFEVETDKSNMDVEATDAGRLARIVVPEGGTLPVLQPVAFLAEADADVDAFLASHVGGGVMAAATATIQATSSVAAVPATASLLATAAVTVGGRVKASPAARKIAQDRQVDLQTILQGSGPGGRILSTDVPLTASPASPLRRPMSKMRKAIARNLTLSKQTIPHFYVRLTIDAAPLLAFYQAQKAKYACSINDVIVLACARCIKEFPAFRSRVEGDDIIEIPSVNIGIAVGMDEGLVVPVVIGAERMNLEQIGAETRRLVAAARSGKIEGMGQGTFTITNLGMFGTEEFAAIINPPETGILAVGATREAVIVKDGTMRPGKVLTITLSTDHRVVDGLLAAKFFARLKELLEAPEKLLS